MVTVTMEMPRTSSSYAAQTPGTAVGAVSNDAASGSGRHIKKANMKFNLVFVFFPALFGLAMAL